MEKSTIRKIAHRGAHFLFWSWNIIFLAFMFLGFAPTMLPELIDAVRTGVVPAQFLAYAAILVLIPLVGIVLGLTMLRRSPRRLLALGYGIEGPLMLMVAMCFFAIRQATPIMVLLLVIGGLSLATFLWQILDQHIEAHKPFLRYLSTAGLTLLLTVGLYAAAWVTFYAVPIPVITWQMLINMFRYGFGDLAGINIWGMFLIILGPIVAAYTATLLIVMPIAVPFLYIRAWWRGLQRFIVSSGRLRAVGLSATVLVVCAVLFAVAVRQPQHRAFAMLENPPDSPAEARALLKQQDTIRAGLLNAYLAPARYISAVGEVYHVSELFIQAFSLKPEQAVPIQQAYEVVARPMLYEPVDPPKPESGVQQWDNRVFREEPARAAELYKTFFDESIIDAERDTVVRAARSTWSLSQAQAAWQAVDDREVHLVHQEIDITEHGDWAEVELYEVYQNQTTQLQEVVYYFSLPESAVVTGVWLGDSSDRDARFAYQVSPRGAAQEMYRSEVRYNLDPALVEQIGPRQYRLRIFPIEPKVQRWEENSSHSTIEDGPEMHMWLTYRVFAGGDAWPLPRLAEKFNVYWDRASVRLIDDEQMPVGSEDWLPVSVPAASPVEPVAHRVDFPEGEMVVARPVSAGDLPIMPDDLRPAVVLDRSRSMAAHEAEVEAALAQVTELAGADIDIYLTASAYRGEEPSRARLSELDSSDILYYGGQNAAELLVQFGQLQAGEDYDVVLVLTDGTGYELGSDGVEVPIPSAPVWMVHLGGEFPLGYDDATLGAIQASGGGVAGSIEEALTRLAVGLEAEDSAAPYDVIDGYVWQVIPAESAETLDVSDDGFDALAARRLILAEMVRHRGTLDQLGTLDTLHAIAVEHSVVTPYSSMIVLVNKEQQRRLEQLEEGDDRFAREHEDVGETMTELGLTAVPEPEEWLLLGLAAAMLLWYSRGKLRSLLHGRTV